MNAERGPSGPGANARQRIGYLDALSFAFRGDNTWTNLGIGVVFSLIPLVGPVALVGWHAEILRRMATGYERPVPKLDFADFVPYLQRGLVPFVVRLLAILPGAMVSAGIAGVGIAVGVAATSHRAMSGEAIALGVAIAVGALFAVNLATAALVSGVVTHAELAEDFGRAFSLGPAARYARLTALTTLLAYVAFGVISFALVIAGLIAFFVGVYLASQVLQLAAVHLRWQLYSIYLARGGEPFSVKPIEALPSELAPRARPAF